MNINFFALLVACFTGIQRSSDRKKTALCTAILHCPPFFMSNLTRVTGFHEYYVWDQRRNDHEFRSVLVHGDVTRQHSYLCIVAIAGYVAMPVLVSIALTSAKEWTCFQNQMIIDWIDWVEFVCCWVIAWVLLSNGPLEDGCDRFLAGLIV
jgi:hypothetical protein